MKKSGSPGSTMSTSSARPIPEILSWDCERVGTWLAENQLDHHKPAFIAHQITGNVLLELNYPILKELGVVLVGERARLLTLIKKTCYTSSYIPSPRFSHAILTPSTSSSAIGLGVTLDKPVLIPARKESNPELKEKILDLKDKAPIPMSNYLEGQTPEPKSPKSEPPIISKRKGPGATPLVITPRTSSMKNVGLQSEDSSPKSAHPNAEKPTLLKEQEKDIMDLPGIRERCIRVHGNNNQSHIVKVAGITDATLIREKVMLKFGIIEPKEIAIYGLYVPTPNVKDSFTLLNDEELIQIIATTDHIHRSLIHLRKKPIVEQSDEESKRSRKKLAKFFGAAAAPPPSPRTHFQFFPDSTPTSTLPPQEKTDKSKRSSKAPLSDKSKRASKVPLNDTDPDAEFERKPGVRSSKLERIFGERPTDEMIADQLEQFFPNIKRDEKGDGRPSSLKSIIHANAASKRQSQFASAFLTRRSSRSSIAPLPSRASRIELSEPVVIEEVVVQSVDSIHLDDEIVDSSTSEVPSSSEPKPEPVIRWEQGQLIGTGAFGRVYCGLNLETGQIMAVKQVILGGSDSTPLKKKQEDSFRREIELLKELNHENIVLYLGFEVTETAFNVFLEYVSGGSVASCLAKCGKFTDLVTRIFAGQILCGLEYLHSMNIIHRDIKGPNSHL